MENLTVGPWTVAFCPPFPRSNHALNRFYEFFWKDIVMGSSILKPSTRTNGYYLPFNTWIIELLISFVLEGVTYIPDMRLHAQNWNVNERDNRVPLFIPQKLHLYRNTLILTIPILKMNLIFDYHSYLQSFEGMQFPYCNLISGNMSGHFLVQKPKWELCLHYYQNLWQDPHTWLFRRTRHQIIKVEINLTTNPSRTLLWMKLLNFKF